MPGGPVGPGGPGGPWTERETDFSSTRAHKCEYITAVVQPTKQCCELRFN